MIRNLYFIIAIVFIFSACRKSDYLIEGSSETFRDNGEGTGTVTWEKNKEYLLEGFVFVNDGSKDNTYQKLKLNFEDTNHFVLNLDKNVGKAEAVRQGVLFVQSLDIYPSIEWLGFWDADLAMRLVVMRISVLAFACMLVKNK